MDLHTAETIIKATHKVRAAAAVALSMLALFLFVGTIVSLKEIRFIGSGVTASNTITVSGEGEVFAIPDIGSFSVSVQKEAKEVRDAQDEATKVMNAIIAKLKEGGIDEKDIKTTDYNVYPQYDWVESKNCTQYRPCPGEQVLRGYQVSQTLHIKVRDTKKAGDILASVGDLGATTISGLSFEVDDDEALKAQARGKAIADAEAKAKVLAEQLGVRLVRVVGFSEGGGYYPTVFTKVEAFGGAMDAEVRNAPEIPVGENKIQANVNVTYEIR